MSRRIRHRSITALMLIACLLFQQMAMASFACTMVSMSAGPVVMAEDCEAMTSAPVQQLDAVCEQHCAPDPTSASTQNVPDVPALALPPVSFGLTVSEDPGQAGFVPDSVFARWDSPSRVRYCRLLI